MNIWVNGADQTERLKPAITQSLDARNVSDGPDDFPADISALSLAAAQNESDYLTRLITLLRMRENIHTGDFHIPRRAGRRGNIIVRVKQWLWRLLRYQHDRMSFSQNQVNSMLAGALEFEIHQRQKAMAKLEKRIAELEKGTQ